MLEKCLYDMFILDVLFCMFWSSLEKYQSKDEKQQQTYPTYWISKASAHTTAPYFPLPSFIFLFVTTFLAICEFNENVLLPIFRDNCQVKQLLIFYRLPWLAFCFFSRRMRISENKAYRIGENTRSNTQNILNSGRHLFHPLVIKSRPCHLRFISASTTGWAKNCKHNKKEKS